LIPRDFFRNIRQAPILRRVCLFCFLIGSALSAIVVGLQTYAEYRDEKLRIEQCFQQQLEASRSTLAAAIIAGERAVLQAELKTIETACAQTNRFDDRVLWTIRQEGQQKEIMGGPDPFDRWLVIETAIQPADVARMQQYWLGDVRLVHGLDRLYGHHADQALGEIVTFIVILAICAGLALVLGYSLIVKRAREFVYRVRNRDFTAVTRARIEKENSELSRLWQVVLALRDELEGEALVASQRARQRESERNAAVRDSEMKSQFLAKMSHELRTSMNGLLGFSTLLMESRLNDEQREYAQTIQVSLESLLHVVNDVLDLSRIESGDLHITNIPFSFRSLLSGISALLRKRAESKGLHFESRISPEVPQNLRGDPVRIRQILLNLVSNAIQHTESGHVLINLEQVRSSENDATLRISIEDTGPAPDKRRRNDNGLANLGVSPFSAELRDKRSVGMDVCYQLADLMNAELGFNGEAGKGSTFWLELTLPTVKPAASPSAINLANLKKLRVLVIDSYELSRKITLELLQGWGVDFRAVTTAEEAIELLQQNETGANGINLILCDDLLQDLAGIEACKRIRQIVPKDVGIVILCSNPQLGDAEGFFLSGANGFLSKQQRDPYLRDVMCQVYEEREGGEVKRLVTRYTIQDAALSDDPATEAQTGGVNESVLVVEDNIVNQQLATRLLEKKGFQVDVAANGFEAIELFKSNTYQLIFMDCLMPDMDGYETTQIIREIEKSRQYPDRTPIVALTAHAIAGEADRCFQVGMDEFITKPFKLKQLEMVLERYIH